MRCSTLALLTVALMAAVMGAAATAAGGSASPSGIAVTSVAAEQHTDALAVSTTETTQAPSLGASPFPCSYTAPDGKYFDFSRLTSASGTSVVGKASDTYNINVCGGIPNNPKCTTASLCMQFVYFPADSYNLADNSNTPANAPPTFSLIKPGDSTGGVQLFYNNGKMDATNVKTYFQFQCDQSATTSYTPQRTAQDTWTILVSSPEACPTTKPSGGGSSGSGSGKGLSGGTVFTIIVLVLFFVYFVGGCIFKRVRQGTQGLSESTPNIDFWRDLPGLVKDGCLFTVAKVRGLCGSRGGSAADGSYESM